MIRVIAPALSSFVALLACLCGFLTKDLNVTLWSASSCIWAFFCACNEYENWKKR